MRIKSVFAVLIAAVMLCGCADFRERLIDELKERDSGQESSQPSDSTPDGIPISNERNFGYWDVGDGLLIAKYHGTAAEVGIPETIHGKQVLGINYSVFENNVILERVSVPEGATIIDERAFYGCTELVEVKLPESMTIIAGEAFAECGKLSKIKIPSGMKRIADDAFSGCEEIRAEYKGKIYDYEHINELYAVING